MAFSRHKTLDTSDLSVGPFSLTLARLPDPLVVEAQKLRYSVFFEEHPDTKPKPEVAKSKIDSDAFDAECDHLLVMHKSDPSATPKVVGTYRLRAVLEGDSNKKLYTQTEFDMDNMLSLKQNIIELGRSCTAKDFREGAVIQLLWRGIAKYIELHQAAYLIGCASFPGSNAMEHQLGLSYLHHYHLADKDICPKALSSVRANVPLLPIDAIDKKKAFASLPTLIKGYLRIGAVIGDGAVIDHECNTTDVFIVVKTALIAERYKIKFEVAKDSGN